MRNSDPFLVDLMSRVQNALGPDLREEIAGLLAANRAQQLAGLPLPADGTFSVEALARDGYLPLGRLLDLPAVDRLVGFLQERPVYAAHVPVYSDGVPRSIAATRALSDYGSYKLQDVVAAPGLLDLALNEDVVALASAYLGALPYIYSIHAWWTYPGGGAPARTHRIHRDQDDFRFLSLFVYLTDVQEPADGPTVYYAGSHRKALLAERTVNDPDPAVRAAADRVGRIELFFPPRGGNATRYNEALQELLAQQAATLTGVAGSAFIADTFGLHCGTPPARQQRLALWIRYGLYKNWAYKTDRTAPAQLPAADYDRLTPVQRLLLELVVSPPDGAPGA
ncbi:MAG: hypothetical protein RIB84_20685 [Sneathiellaceae bacterium]